MRIDGRPHVDGRAASYQRAQHNQCCDLDACTNGRDDRRADPNPSRYARAHAGCRAIP